MKTLRILLSTLLLCVAAEAAVQLNGPGATEHQSLLSLTRSGTLYVSVTQLCEALDIDWEWKFYEEKLFCSSGRHSLMFTQDLCWYLRDDTVMQMRLPPIRDGQTLYLTVSEAARVFALLCNYPLRWSGETNALILGTSAFSVTGIGCAVTENTTIVTVALADSLPFFITTRFPRVILSITGGAVDTNLFRELRWQGLVDSALVAHKKDTLLLTFFVQDSIEPVQLEYLRDIRKLIISFVPKNLRKLQGVPDSLLASGGHSATIKTVVIDPGHGGYDPGAVGTSKTYEKNVVLAIGLALRNVLRDSSTIKVYMTRSTDEFIALGERTSYANGKRADLFISIHANSIQSDKKRRNMVSGYEVFFLSEAKNDDARRTAMMENEVVNLERTTVSTAGVQNILLGLTSTEYLRESQDLCVHLDETFSKNLAPIKKAHNGIDQANFFVLNGAFMPSVLIEVGYISNPDEEKQLNDSAVQKQIAVSIYRAIMKFKKQYEAGL